MPLENCSAQNENSAAPFIGGQSYRITFGALHFYFNVTFT